MTLDLPVQPPLRERFTQVIVKLCDFRFARATASPGEIYTGNCEALFLWICATASPGEIYTGNCEALGLWIFATASPGEIYTVNCEAL